MRRCGSYHNLGLSTLVVTPRAVDVLRPDEGRTLAKGLLTALESHEALRHRDWVVHAFSVGGYIMGQALDVMRRGKLPVDGGSELGSPDELDFGGVRGRLRAQTFDSPVDFDGVAVGLPAAITRNPVVRPVLTAGVSAFLALRRDSSAKHRACSHHFHNNDLADAPALWFYSDADTLGPAERCEVVMEKWRGRGIEVRPHRFEKSPHVQHYRHHPDEYAAAIEALLRDVGVLREL